VIGTECTSVDVIVLAVVAVEVLVTAKRRLVSLITRDLQKRIALPKTVEVDSFRKLEQKGDSFKAWRACTTTFPEHARRSMGWASAAGSVNEEVNRRWKIAKAQKKCIADEGRLDY
jgi:hypothetical protein